MRAIVLAGGKGVRLKPYTTTLPKPLMPLGDEMPILEVVIKQLKKNGFKHITIAVNHLSNIIMAFFGNGEKWGVKIDYSLEEEPLGTIGPVTLIDDLPDDFLLMNGDLLTDINYREFFEYHQKNKNDVTVASYKRKQNIDFGIIEANADNEIIGFAEKPDYDFGVSMGIYIIKRKVIEKLPKGKPYGFDNLMLDGIASDMKMQVMPFQGYWLDIGRPDDYEQANKDFSGMKDKLL
ncbi:sugar phosphate nucleotidyltransferase [Candidatus Margulisiibacteriota bacterium]